MTTYLFSAIADGAEIHFDSETDVLAVDSGALSAADFTLTALPGDGGVLWTGGGKNFTLTGTPLSGLGEGTVTFADGSMLVNSCAANGFALDLSGTPHDDLLLGSPTAGLHRVSETADGTAGDDSAGTGALSADGRYVAFSSSATNLGSGAETNGFADIFLKDLQTGSITRVSTNSAGEQAVDNSGWGDWYPGSENPTLTADGRHVVFQSAATNLVSGDSNRVRDIFVKDVQTGAVVRVSTSAAGGQANSDSLSPSVSADGRYIAFDSLASNLGVGDTSSILDVFVKDTLTGTVTLVSSSSSGVAAAADPNQNGSGVSMISADGRFVVFESWASNLVDGDDNATADVFVKNLQTGELLCVSRDIDGGFANGMSRFASISSDGRYVAFQSDAPLLGDGQDGAGAIYQRDLQTGALIRVVGGGSPWAYGWAGATAMSGDGRFVVFATTQALVAGDSNEGYDIYVKDTQTGALARISVGEAGQQAPYNGFAQISSDGGTIVFQGGSELAGGSGPAQIFSVANPLLARTLRGGAGDDVYQVGSPYDQVVEAAGQGNDTVRATVTVTLAANVENLLLTGTAAIDGRGNALNNVITGNTGNNLIAGGAGNDRLDGAAGSDTVSYDDAKAGVSVDLGVVTAQATGGAGTDTLTGFENVRGSAFTDRLTGTAAANLLDGAAGADTLTGGAGNDTYIVDSTQDVVVEQAGGGTDTVRSSVDTALHSGVENLVLLGAAAINGYGNTAANQITGNSAANVLGGGQGADTLTGGGGTDTYVVDNAGDVIVEGEYADGDTVRAAMSWTLGDKLENLTLTGTGAINGTGNALDNLITGNAAANVLAGGAGTDTLAGGDGSDVYLLPSEVVSQDVIVEAANGGIDEVRSSTSYVLGAELENLTLLDYATDGTGNTQANRLTGNEYNNLLDGKAGADTLVGSIGNDTYIVDHTGDQVVEAASGGGDQDSVQSSISWTLSANVERLTLSGSAATNGTGNAQDNIISGNGAANVLDGGAGADVLYGGGGNDTYIVDDIHDGVGENFNAGVDTVRSSVDHTLHPEVENLVLTGTSAVLGYGNSLNNSLVGTASSNALSGEGGNDTVDGGAGLDTLWGGSGNDTYVVDNRFDLTIELAGEGTDLVRSSISLALQTEIENLTLTGTAAIDGTGNTLANVITGNASANVLDGDVGADTLTGAGGNDSYVVDNAADKTIEVSGGGADSVRSSISWALAAEVENLTLTGSATINATGNSLANILTGNSANNYLNGSTGADTMTGGTGNDTYLVENAGDKTIELAGGGFDAVQSSVAFTLQAEVEKLTLTGTAAVNGAGNSIANVLTGNSAANVLTGGAGADTLTGGAGNDTFALNSTLGSDLISDFAHAIDKLRITQSLLRVGDGDTVIDGGVSVTGPNGFAASAELVIVTHDIAGGLTSSSAATAIGHANSAYSVGDTRLFVVDNGSDSGVYLFKAADANATISASELTLLATLDSMAGTTVGDYLFGA